MPRIALWNIFFGFLAVFVGALAGPFMVNDVTAAIVVDPQRLNEWSSVLQRSSHGHLGLFGLLQIAFGLTLPFSCIHKPRLRLLQTIGFVLGAVAMGPLMYAKSYIQPNLDVISWLDVSIGICLSAALFSVALHLGGLGLKLLRYE